jgi:hypothetical protein
MWLAAPAPPVRLFVFATDARGAAVDDLAATDVDVRVSGAGCPIGAFSHGGSPMRVALVADTSEASMGDLRWLRDGLNAVVDGLPAGADAAFVEVGGGYRLRLRPTSDRTRLHASVNALRPELDGGTQVARALLESHAALFDGADRWPIFVIVASDAAENPAMVKQTAFDAFTDRLRAEGATVHSVLLPAGGNSGSAKVLDAMLKNLASNTHGVYHETADGPGLTAALAGVASRIAEDAGRMAGGYQVEFTCAGAIGGGEVEIGTSRPGVHLSASQSRTP